MDTSETTPERHDDHDGDERDKKSPERTCVVTRRKMAANDLIRFVRGPDGAIVPDVASRLPGRGVWVTADRETVGAAARGGAFARSLKRAVTVPADLVDMTDWLLARRALAALSLANKAGQVVPGFTKVEISIARGEAVALVHAAEASEDGAGKLDRRFRAISAELGTENVAATVTIFTVSELSLAIGRPNVVHAALLQGGASMSFLREATRLARYRSQASLAAEMTQKSGSKTEQA